MKIMPGRRKQSPAEQREFGIFFGYNYDMPGLDPKLNCRLTDACGLEFTPLHLVITGRRFRSEQHIRRIRHAYVIGDYLQASIIGMLAMPLLKLYIDIFTNYLTEPARLVYDLDQICDVGGDRDVVGFSVLERDGAVKAVFCGNTSLDDTGRINTLLESTGHRVSRLPLP